MKRFIPLLFLAACAGQAPPPQIITKEVDIPVKVSCVPKDTPPAPTYPDTREALIGAPDAATRYKLMAEGWGLKTARLNLLEQIVGDCK